MATLKPVRRTQTQRSDQTQAAVQAATLRLLLEVGYSRLTMFDVARAAGMSRGALTHHYATREDLIVRSIEAQLDQVTVRLHGFAIAQGDRPELDAVIDYLWAVMSDGLFYITMEYLPEARHNPPFRQRLIPVVERFHAGLDAVWTGLAAATGLPADHARTMLNATMCLIRGMVAQSVLRDGAPYYDDILGYWKRHLHTEIAAARTTGSEDA